MASKKLLIIITLSALASLGIFIAINELVPRDQADLLINGIQTAAIVITVIWLIVDYKHRLRERGYQTYLQSSIAYTELEKLILQYPELERIYDEEQPTYTKPEARRVYHWYYIFFMNLEVVFHAYDKKWMDDGVGWMEEYYHGFKR